MYGHVLSYSVQTGEGVISGEDGTRYRFTSRDYMGPDVPRQGTRVDFASGDGQAVSIYPASPVTGGRNEAASALPAIAAGCGAGCVAYFLLAFVLVLVLGSSLKAIFSPGSGSGVLILLPRSLQLQEPQSLDI